MSIQSEINRINSNVQAALNAVADTGVSVPENANSNDLPAAVLALANEKQDKLTGTQGQVVGFDAEGNPVAQDKPSYTANDVSAVPAEEKGAPEGVATLGADGKVPTGQLPAMDYAPSTHASQHGSGGSDPITPAAIGAAAASHNQAASTITAGTFAATGVKAMNGTDYTTARVRNIQASTTDLTAGSSSLSNGDIYLVYE